MALTNKGEAKKTACLIPGMLWLVLMLAGTMETTARISRSLSLSGRVMGQARQFLDQLNSSRLGDYSTVGVGAAYELERFQARLGVFNVLDTEYNSDGYIGLFGEERLYPAAGRHFSLTLQSRL